MPPVLVIAGKDLRQRVRDRSAVVIGVVAPLVIAALMSLAFKGTETFHFTLGVVNADRGPAAAGMLAALGSPGIKDVIRTRPVADRAAAEAGVRDRKLQAALVIPAGFSASLASARPESLATLTSVNNTVAASITAAVAQSFVAQLNADRLSAATALSAGAGPPAAVEAAAAALTLPEQVVQRPLGAKPLKAVSYYSPAMAIFFLLFTVSYTARSFFVDRQQGMIERMRAAPVRPGQILLGKALSVLVFGVASMATVVAVTSAAFGADWGGLPAAAAVCVAMVLAVVALTALVIALARTQRQAEGIAAAIVFGLALLGGNFVFISMAPEALRRLSLLTPNGWALRAFTDLSTTGGGLGSVLVPLAAMVSFTVVVATVALALARRAVTA